MRRDQRSVLENLLATTTVSSLFHSQPSTMLPTTASPPVDSVFKWTDALRSLISPHNVDAVLARDRATQPAIPTNAWWGNLLAWDAHASTPQRDSDPIFSNPYVYHVAGGRGLSVGYLHDYRTDGPINENGAIKFYFYPATIKNLVFSATEWTSRSAGGRGDRLFLQIDAWDDLGVALTMASTAGFAGVHDVSPAQFARMYLSMGNAFTTVEYQGLHAQLQSDHGIIRVNDTPYQEGAQLQSNEFVVHLNNGQKWMLTFFPSAAATLGGGRLGRREELRVVLQHNTITTVEPFFGVVQAAIVCSQDCRDEVAISSLYREVAGVYPVASKLVLDSKNNAESFGFEWTLRDVRPPSPSSLFGASCPAVTHLHFALPHMEKLLDSSSVVRRSELQLWSHTRGRMQAYTLRANDPAKGLPQWRFRVPEELSEMVDTQATAFFPVHGTPLSRNVVAEIGLVDVLHKEIAQTDWRQGIPHEGSYYFKGKALQKFATMCLVAQQLVASTHPELKPLLDQGVRQLRELILAFVKNVSAYPLVYDTVYRGIISSEALHKRDINVDFGNAVYNDHHYHYGYLVTAIATLLNLPNGVESIQDRVELQRFVETLLRDVANPEASDPFFPRFRHFNWFLGHSYSHGVTPMADGKDEESTSEEVNFLYGTALYARVTSNRPLENLAKLMLKVNTLAIRTYFLLEDSSRNIHPPTFLKNKVTGICFDNKCDYATWFNPARECIHGIQMLPVSPMLDVVRSRTFVREEWEQILAGLDCVKNWEHKGTGWTSLLYSNAAVLNPLLSTHVLAKVPMDDGLSRAWALYMAATKRTT
ncbi:hypothetical protein ATCC90586_005186 [Pythium insidiosum]|nr:hypothetical protein ATCC90586_005186 [Pythium insidiosum]